MGKIRSYDFSDDDTDNTFDEHAKAGKHHHDFKDIDTLYKEAENYVNHRKKKNHRYGLSRDEEIA